MNNMEIWGKICNTPKEAQKTIEAGRLKGFTDINPMWRFKALTDAFGPCGVGWKYEIVKKEIISSSNGESKAFVDILLYYKHDGAWSDGIPGTGGSSFESKERNGLYASDECFKMALTDAIGTACKALGMSADIYFAKDRSKYTAPVDPPQKGEDKVKTAAGIVLRFGQYQGKTLGELYRLDQEHFLWLAKNTTDQEIKDAIDIMLAAVKK